MKKKAIEKIPYLTLSKMSRKRNAKYVAVTAFKIIAHEKHLFMEVYRNSKDTKSIPLVRIVLTKKDFGNFFPDSGEWTRQNIKTDDYWNMGLLWRDSEDRGLTYRRKVQQNILSSENDIARISKMCSKVSIREKEEWWEYIHKYEKQIREQERLEANKRKYERRQRNLDERIINTPKLDEKKIIEAESKRVSRKHYLYYKKSGSWAQIACSACGTVTDGRWKMGMGYESQFQRWVEEPREKYIGACPVCGAAGEYKCQGRVKGEYRKAQYVFLGQKYKATGMVIRYIEIEKKWRLDLTYGEKGEEMIGAGEEIACTEIARAYFEEGKKVQIDYHKNNPYTGKNFWDDCNLAGMANIEIKKGYIMQETYEQMQETIFQYSGLKEYVQAAGEELNPIDYLERYMQTPQLEMLSKMRLVGVVEKLIRCCYGIVADINAERPDKFLGIRKEHLKLLIKEKGNENLMEVMQAERRLGLRWTDEQVEHLAETEIKMDQIQTVIQYMSIQKLLNRIKKYAGCEYGTGCNGAIERLREIATTYIDYLQMRIQRGYDLNNTVYQFPRNLFTAHAQMIAETVIEKEEERILEVRKNYPFIRKNYRKLRNKYFYEDDTFVIRPARSAEEIVLEGRTLHHCVGGNYYLGEHNKGEAYILFLRHADQKEIPYVTVEINAENNKIKQWYGANDKKPDEKNISKWLSSYIEWLEGASKTSGIRKNKEMAENLLVAAI